MRTIITDDDVVITWLSGKAYRIGGDERPVPLSLGDLLTSGTQVIMDNAACLKTQAVLSWAQDESTSLTIPNIDASPSS